MKLIYLTNGDVAKVSDEDFLFLCGRDWHVQKDGYAWCKSGDLRNQLMHRVVAGLMGLDLSNEIDHENREKLDNQRHNLRPATHGQNQANGHCYVNSESGLRGVRQVKSKWVARLQANGKRVHLGTFDTQADAYSAYCAAAKEKFGDFAHQ